MYAFERFILSLLVFASVSIFSPSKVCAQNETSCISNYAELKQALLDQDTGNMERLLYSFTPTNNPIPHYVWVFYYHNESAEWEDVLRCPSSNNLVRCPRMGDGTEGDTSYHVLFWADSPLLINMDIPLLRFLSYNSILQYIENVACVQLVIPPFCSSVDKQLIMDMLKFATSYLRAYSISIPREIMRNRDYVLHCDDKYEVELAYDAFLMTSEIIICLGSAVFFVFVGFKLCSIKGDTAGEVVSRIWYRFARCPCGNAEKAVSDDTLPEQQSDTEAISRDRLPDEQQYGSSANLIQDTSVSESDPRSKIKVSATLTYKNRISVLMVINSATIFSLIIDTTLLLQNKDVAKHTFPYGYGIIGIILFALAYISILAQISVLVVFILTYCKDRIQRRRAKSRDHDKNTLPFSSILNLNIALTIAPFLYILTRAFVVLLAFATYPQDVGLVLLAIGSGVVAFLFVIWAAIHITVDSREQQVKCWDIFVSLIPYWTLLLILAGFLLSYIFVILRIHIHPVDPVTSLLTTLFPGLIAFVAGRQYDKQRQLIINEGKGKKGKNQTGVDTHDAIGQPHRKQSFESTDFSSKKGIEEFELQCIPSISPSTEPPEVIVAA